MSETSLSPAIDGANSSVPSPGDLPLDQAANDTHRVFVEGSEAAPAMIRAIPISSPREQSPHRQVFLDTHPGSPWECVFCGGEVLGAREEDGRKLPSELHVHHRDNDHGNNDPDNLAATHADCHAHHHRAGLESFDRPEKATALRIAAGALDDIEALRKAIHNQERGLRAHNLLDAKAEKLIATQKEHIKKMETAATLALKHAVREHPLSAWIKSVRGINEKSAGRLLAAIGEPAYNAAEDRPRRGPAELWAYCGYAPGQKRKRGTKSNWNAEAKVRAFICADAAVKSGIRKLDGAPVKFDLESREPISPLGEVYYAARASWEDRDTSDGHKHNHAIRLVAKAILKDIFLQTIKDAMPSAAASEGSS